jgi:phosphoribosylglycinamide formyltransferase 1
MTTPRPPLPAAVLISGGGSTLENLVVRLRDGRLRGLDLRLVISSRGAVPGVQIARDAGLPVAIVRKRDFADEAAFSNAITVDLDQAGAELVILAGFLCFWRIPARYQGRVLNIHPALLPEFGGRGFYGGRVHAAVLAAGVTESGCTVHLADNEYDHGPMIAQARVRVMPGDTPEALARRVGAAERELYPAVIQRVVDEGLTWLAAAAASRGAPNCGLRGPSPAERLDTGA